MKEIIRKYLIRYILIVLVYWAVGLFMERSQAEHHNPYIQHFKMEQNGYNYCPYCGEKLSESEDKE